MATPASRTVPVIRLDPEPWWRVGVMWLFVGGLGAVVVGSFALLFTAIEHADVVLPQSPMMPVPYRAAASGPRP